MKLAVHKEAAGRLPMAKMRKLFEALTDEEADPGSSSSINVIFTSDRKIRTLNRTYRNIDRATDVLSFNVDDQTVPDGVFGEIYISTATARKQAAAYGAGLAEEILRLLCHGLLHLFGYDHQVPRQEKQMKAREEYYLNTIHGSR
jgi:probable rRNA maturation factor